MENVKQKRIQKRNRLYKTLFYKLAKNSLSKNIISLIKFKVVKNNLLCRSNAEYHFHDLQRRVVKKIIITLVLSDIPDFTKQGLSNLFYANRKKYTDNFLIKNRKKAVRFILLHELYHAKKRLKFNNEYTRFEELQADRFAIDKIKGGIK